MALVLHIVDLISADENCHRITVLSKSTADLRFYMIYEHLCLATLLKSHFNIVILREICCMFSEDLFLKTPLEGCFC